MADFVTKTTESDRALERIHQLLAEIKAHQQSRLNYLKYPFQFFPDIQNLQFFHFNFR